MIRRLHDSDADERRERMELEDSIELRERPRLRLVEATGGEWTESRICERGHDVATPAGSSYAPYCLSCSRPLVRLLPIEPDRLAEALERLAEKADDAAAYWARVVDLGADGVQWFGVMKQRAEAEARSLRERAAVVRGVLADLAAED
jgi:hypothetical protein